MMTRMGEDYIDNDSNISIGLIKANRTRVGDSSVSGITIGYDVFGGGAGNEKDGTHEEGYAGGFVGLSMTKGFLRRTRCTMQIRSAVQKDW